MKLGSKISILLLAICQNGWAQGFVNLDFENPILPLTPNGGLLPATNAIPGWTAYYGSSTNPTLSGPLTTIYYNGYSLGGAIVALQDTNALSYGAIQGNYSVLLQGSIPFAAVLASIGETGTIPNTAQSLTFFGILAGNLQVTFNGQPLSVMDISNALNYTIWGADISAYAGQTGQLLFTVPVLHAALIDNIQFSSVPIPEPSLVAFTALGALFLGFRHWRNSSR